MLGLVETLLGRTQGSLRGFLEGLGRIKLLKNVNHLCLCTLPRYLKEIPPTSSLNRFKVPLNRFIVVNRFNDESIHPVESIQLPVPFLPSSFTYTHPIDLGVRPQGS